MSDTLSQHRTAFIVLGGSLSALSMIVVPMMQSLVPLIALVMAMGVFGAISRASSVAIRTERGRVHGMGAVTGAYISSVSAGQVFGPLVFGAVVGAFGIQDAFYLGGVVGLLGTAGAYWFLHTASDQSGASPVSTGDD